MSTELFETTKFDEWFSLEFLSTTESVINDVTVSILNDVTVSNHIGYNVTTDGSITVPSQKVQIGLYSILMPLVGTIVIILNLAVVISSGLILKKGSQPRATYLFLGNVALSDLTTAIAILFGNFYPKENRSQLTCAFSLGMIVSSTIVSIYSVGLIAIDRYLYIIHGLNYQRWVYPVRARICIVMTWFIGCVIGFLPVMGWSGDTYNGRFCWFIKLLPAKLILMTCIAGVIPIILVIVLYSIILYHAIKKVIHLKSSGAPQKNENDLRIFRGRNAVNVPEVETEKNIFKRFFKRSKLDKINSNKPSKGKAVKIVLFTTGSFVITWVPYFMASFMYVFCDKGKTPEKCRSLEVLIASPLAILGFVNSLLNPIIYAWWHNGFRTFVKKLWCKKSTNDNSNGTTSTNTESQNSRKTSAIKNNKIHPVTELPMENIDLST